MRKYEVLANVFVSKLKLVKTKKVNLYRLSKSGQRLVNKRTGLYKLIFSEINALSKNYKNAGLKSVITVYGKVLAKNDFNEVGGLVRFMMKDIYKEIGISHKESLERRVNDAKLVIDGDKLINLAISYIKSFNYKRIAVGLALLTGRRTSEVLQSGKFTIIDSSHLLFSGQLKQNDSKAYVIPVLCDSALIVKAVKNLRILKQYKKVSDVNEKEANNLNSVVRQMTANHCDEMSMHDLRKFYAYVCYHYKFNIEAKTGTRQTFGGFTKQILGHRALKSGDSYKTVEVEL